MHHLPTGRMFVKVLGHGVQDCNVWKVFLHQIQLSSSCPVGLPVGGGGAVILHGKKETT